MLVNQTVKYNLSNDPLSVVFSALADPTRRLILSRLSEGDVTVMELAEPFDMSLPAISKHLKILEKAGLISRTKNAQWRPCHLEASALMSASSWIRDYEKLWTHNLDNLDSYLTQINKVHEE